MDRFKRLLYSLPIPSFASSTPRSTFSLLPLRNSTPTSPRPATTFGADGMRRIAISKSTDYRVSKSTSRIRLNQSLTYILTALLIGFILFLVTQEGGKGISKGRRTRGGVLTPKLRENLFQFGHDVTTVEKVTRIEDGRIERVTRVMEGRKEGVVVVQQQIKYLTRDWSLRLGFNNMRYIIETGLLHAQLLNRTLILPSFLYGRDCEQGLECTNVWNEVNLVNAVTQNQWIPVDAKATSGRGWVVPIETMIDLPALRRKYAAPIITVSDYLSRYSLDPKLVLERRDGTWNQAAYQVPFLTYAAVDRSQFIANHFIRVDSTKPPIPIQAVAVTIPARFTHALVSTILKTYFGDVRAKTFRLKSPLLLSEFMNQLPSEVRRMIEEQVRGSLEAGKESVGLMKGDRLMGFVEGKDAHIELVKRWLDVMMFHRGCEWMVLRTYEDYHEAFLSKPTHRIEYSLAYRVHLKGFVQDYNGIEADVLHLTSEFHDVIKPGAMRFTSIAAQAKFTKIILQDMSTDPAVEKFAQELDRRMRLRCDGRQWMGAHMRRGDFPPDWVVSPNISLHIDRVKDQFKNGLAFLTSSRASQLAGRIVPGAPDYNEKAFPLPEPLDPFYIATDERDPRLLAEMRAAGGVVLADLMTDEDRAQLGENTLLSDWLGLIEKALLAKSAFFFGARLSSFTGGVVNLRVGLAKGWNTIAVG